MANCQEGFEGDKEIIFKVNDKNTNAIELLLKYDLPEGIHFLYDGSCGNNIEIGKIEYQFDNYTGYAGGISPENIEEKIKMIQSYQNDSKVWIDMESGVRTDDKFDLIKVETVLEIASKYIKK